MDFLSDQTLGELVAQVDAFAIPFPPCLGGRKMEKKVGGGREFIKFDVSGAFALKSLMRGSM